MSGAVTHLYDTHSGDTRFSCARDVTGWLRPRDPVYLFSQASLAARADVFQRGFPGAVSYAVKANPENRVIDALVKQGISHFDVASTGEVEAIATRHRDVTLHFNNPIKASEEIQAGYQRFGVRSFALDEPAEFDKIREATGGDPTVLYSVRFKLGHEGASYDFGSKFGATPEKAAILLRQIAESGARPALTFHPGSQCTDPRMYARYLEAAAQIAAWAEVELEQINVGGGFPEPYANTRVPPLERYFKVIDKAAARCFKHPPRLMCEPGRAMVASSISLLARVIHVREDGRTVFLNDGVYGGLQEQSLVDIQLPARVWREGRQLRGDTVSCHVFGPTCDPVDRLSRSLELPVRVREGDYIEFGLIGAYGSATCTGFNGFTPARYVDVAAGFSGASDAQR